MSAEYYIMMDGQVYGAYSYNEVVNLGILSDTKICTNDSNSQWKEAREYPEFRSLFEVSQGNGQYSVGHNRDSSCRQHLTYRETEDDDIDYDTSSYIERNQQMLLYQQKRKAALIGVLSLGLAGLSIVGVGNTWRGNIFRGTSLDRDGIGFVLKTLSFMILSAIVAIPFFITSLIQLVYYSVKISQMS